MNATTREIKAGAARLEELAKIGKEQNRLKLMRADIDRRSRVVFAAEQKRLKVDDAKEQAERLAEIALELESNALDEYAPTVKRTITSKRTTKSTSRKSTRIRKIKRVRDLGGSPDAEVDEQRAIALSLNLP